MVLHHIGGSRRTRPALIVTAAFLALVLFATSCKSSSNSSSSNTSEATTAKGTNITVPNPGDPKTGGTLKVGLNAETGGWSPSLSQWAGSAYIVAGAVFDFLAKYDTDGVARPYLAEAITPNATFTEWTVKMRPNVTFQNGEKCDAAALKLNFDALHKSLLIGPVFANVANVAIVDDLTVKLTMSQPWSTFPDQMTTQPGAMAAPEMINAPDGGVRKPIGTGPFSFVSWVPDSKLETKKNPNYWRSGYPLLDAVEFQVVPDLSSRSAALQSGTVDMIEMGDVTQIKKLLEQAQAGKVQMYTNQGLQQNETFSALNLGAPPFDDLLARQIVAYGTDRDTLSSSVFQGLFPPALGPFSEDEPYYVKTDMPTYDKAKAKELAQQYEQKYGKPLEFTYLITPQPEVQAIAQVGQAQLADIGVKMTLKPEDQATLVSDVILGNYQATGFILFGANTLDVNYVFLSSKTVNPPGQLSLNFTRNNDPVLQQALEDARKTDDRTQQIAQYKIVQDQMAKDLNFVFLVHDLDVIGYSNQTHGLVDQTFPDGSPQQITVVPLLDQTWKS
jgi:peptide/nickel transport system substrate-binding protein